MKRILFMLMLLPIFINGAAKLEFHLRDGIIEKTLQLNQKQMLFEKEIGCTLIRFSATLVQENWDSVDVDFCVKVEREGGRKVTHEFPTETIPLNRIYSLKEAKFTEHLVVNATLIN